jgi:HSP20 family protein
MLARWQPLSGVQNDLHRLQSEMDRLFGRTGNGARSSYVYPAMNLWHDDESFYVEAELPGMEFSDIEIYVDGGNKVTIKGERRPPQEEEGAWHRRECGYGKFSRTFELPSAVDAEKVEAVLTNGVLSITLPKPEEVKPKRISVKAS